MDGHDAGHDRHGRAEFARLLDEVEIGVGVEEELRDRAAGAGVDLVDIVLQVACRVALARVVLGVGGDFEPPVVALGLTDEAHQVGGVAKLAAHRRAAGQVAAQRDDALDRLLAVGSQRGGNALARGAHAGQVRCGLESGSRDGLHGLQGLLTRRAARAIGDAEEFWLQRPELLHHRLQLVVADRGVGRKELEADRYRVGHGEVAHTKYSRLPSPPAMALGK